MKIVFCENISHISLKSNFFNIFNNLCEGDIFKYLPGISQISPNTSLGASRTSLEPKNVLVLSDLSDLSFVKCYHRDVSKSSIDRNEPSKFFEDVCH